MKAQIITGLDIGTHSLKMVIAQKKEEGEDLEILGFGEEPSSGVRKGSVVNPDELAKKISALKNRIENISDQKIGEVFVNIGGSHIFTVPSHGIVAVSRADGQISQEDVERVLQAAQAFSLQQNKEILEVFPQQFLVDGEENLKEVIGMKGVRLEVNVLAVCGSSPYVKNLTDAILASGLSIADVSPSSLMSGAAVLRPQQKELGAAIIDIGAGTTGLAVYEEGDLIHTAIFPVGSENITNDVAIGLRIEPDIAEKVKVEFGTCSGGKGRKMEKMEIPDGPPITFSQKMLNHIIEARVREIFQLVNKDLKKISKQGMLPGGIILVGGGAKLPKIVDFAKKDLKLTVKIGTPSGIISLNSDPAFLGVMGLVVAGADSEYQGGRSRIAAGLMQKIKKVFKPFIP